MIKILAFLSLISIMKTFGFSPDFNEWNEYKIKHGKIIINDRILCVSLIQFFGNNNHLHLLISACFLLHILNLQAN